MLILLLLLTLSTAMHANTFTVVHDCKEIPVYQKQCETISQDTKWLNNQRVSVTDSNGTKKHIKTPIQARYDDGTKTETVSDDNGYFNIEIKEGVSFKIYTYNPYSQKWDTHNNKFKLVKYNDGTLVFRYYYPLTKRWRNLDTSNDNVLDMK